MSNDIVRKVNGMKKEDLDKEFAGTGFTYRVMHEDGNDFIGTCDFVPTRINITIKKGIVTESNIG